jgi:hypothetical protein
MVGPSPAADEEAAGHLRRASQVFETYLPKSFQLDLDDLSTERFRRLKLGRQRLDEERAGERGGVWRFVNSVHWLAAGRDSSGQHETALPQM